MRVQRYKNRKGEAVRVETELEVELADIEWLVQNPNVDSVLAYSSKDECKANQYLIYWGKRIRKDDSRIKQNHGKRCAIMLDYDGEYSIDAFNARFNGKFAYYLYTSISHTPELHKFRVIIPTAEEYEINMHLKAVLKRCFPDTDPSSFDPRGFYEPVQINEHYQYFVSEGSVFNIEKRLGKMVQREQDEWVSNQRIEAQKREQMRIDREAKGVPQATVEARKAGYVAKVIEPLMTSVSWGSDGNNRYSTLGKAMVMMDKADFDMERFDDDEIYDTLHPYLRDKKHIANLDKYLSNRKY